MRSLIHFWSYPKANSPSDPNSRLQAEIRQLSNAIRDEKINRAEQIGQLMKELSSAKDKNKAYGFQKQPQLHVHLAGAASLAREQRILASLRYRSMYVRQDEIKDPHDTTFQWIFKTSNLAAALGRQPLEFVEWLQSRHESGGTYWITGKAGSGKSTFMKFLTSHPQTQRALTEGIHGSERLITASFFFWHAGTALQKSQEGLLQSLLYELLRQCPEAISVLCPERWDLSLLSDHNQWTRQELFETLIKLCSGGPVLSAKFLFFIDGLDEYSGRPSDIVEVLQKVACLSNVKICISSRPWPAFETAFGADETKKLYLHELTKHDIMRYVESKLNKNEHYCQAKTQDPIYGELVSKIADKAKGVFLWVYLVVRSLLEGFENGDSNPFLHERVDELPEELEDLFRRMLDGIDKRYEAKSAQTLLIALTTPSMLPIMTYAFLDEALSNPQQICEAAALPLTDNQIAYRQSQTVRQVNAITKGLLEVSDSDRSRHPYVRGSIDFLHRTVKDFLVEYRATLIERAGPKFQVHVTLEYALLAEFKHFPADTPAGSPQDQQLRDDLTLYQRSAADLLEMTIHHAAEAGLATGQTQEAVLAALLEITSGPPSERADLAVEELDFGRPVSQLLDVCVQYEHYAFIEQELTKRPALLHVGNPPLLFQALLTTRPAQPLSIRAGMVQLLQKYGANPNQPYHNSTVWGTFLHDVIDHEQNRVSDGTGYLDDLLQHQLIIVQSLLSFGADPMVQDKEGGRYSAIYGRFLMSPKPSGSHQRFRYNVLKRFIDAGADPNAPFADSTVWIYFLEKLSRTQFRLQSKYKYEIMELLLNSGASRDVSVNGSILSGDNTCTPANVIRLCFPEGQAQHLEEILAPQKQQNVNGKPKLKQKPPSLSRLFRRFK